MDKVTLILTIRLECGEIYYNFSATIFATEVGITFVEAPSTFLSASPSKDSTHELNRSGVRACIYFCAILQYPHSCNTFDYLTLIWSDVGEAIINQIMSKIKAYLSAPERVPGERKLVRKIDFFILSFCCLMYALLQPTTSISSSTH